MVCVWESESMWGCGVMVSIYSERMGGYTCTTTVIVTHNLITEEEV